MPNRSISKRTVTVIALLALLVSGFFVYRTVFSTKAEDKASLGSAPLVDRTTTTGAAKESADGMWNVVQGEKVFAGYRISHVVAGVDQEVTGRTPDITGSLTVDGESISKGTFEVSMANLTSDQQLRDTYLETRSLETNTFPTATLTLTDPVTLKSAPTIGTEVATTAPAELTLHGVTKPVEVQVTARWNGPTLDISASTKIALADFGIEVPSLPGVTVGDQGTIEAQIALAK